MVERIAKREQGMEIRWLPLTIFQLPLTSYLYPVTISHLNFRHDLRSSPL